MLRTIWLIGIFDLWESLRSKKAIGLLALAFLGSIAAAGVFSRVIYVAEKQMSEKLGVARTEKVGVMAEQVFGSAEFKEGLTDMTGDAGIASEMVRIPPIAFFSGVLGLIFMPLLVILSSADAVSLEVASGSARFALFRCDRLSWALGKFFGQAMLMAVGIAVGAAGVLIVALLAWHEWRPMLTALWMARLGVRVWFFGFTYLGMAMGVSLAFRSVNAARGVSLVMYFALGLLVRLIAYFEHYAPMLLSSLKQLFPHTYEWDLWQPDLVARLPSLVMLAALGTAWFMAGYARFARRDR